MCLDLVLFDLDDVLVEYSREVRCRTLGARIGRSADAVRAALFDTGLETEADLGRVDPDGVARRLSDALGTTVTVADCVAARAAAMRPIAGMPALVDALAARLPLAILTNNGALVRDHFAALCPAFAPYFSGRVHGSDLYGIAKPDPAIFRRCADALGVAPSRVLFIDDRAENADGARAAGMHAHTFRTSARLRAALADFELPEESPHVR